MGGGPDGKAVGAAVVVGLLVAVALTAALAPPAIRVHAARKEAFLLSFGPRPVDPPPPSRRRSQRVACRRRVAGSLLVAMAATLVLGLVPTFRVLLVVHLFLLDSFLAYVALLAHMADRDARRQVQEVRQADVAEAPEPAGAAIHRRPAPRRALLRDLGPVTSAG